MFISKLVFGGALCRGKSHSRATSFYENAFWYFGFWSSYRGSYLGLSGALSGGKSLLHLEHPQPHLNTCL